MATVYVSKSTANGYAVGDDANTYEQAQSKATPWLTLTKAASGITAGDTIIINDGTYNETTYVGFSKVANIQSENKWLAIIRAASGTARVLHFLAAASGSNIGNITIDANSTQTNCVTVDSSNKVDALTFTGTKFLNPTTIFISGTRIASLTMSGGWLMQGLVGQYGVYVPSAYAGTHSISDGTINITANTIAYFNGIHIVPTVTGVNASVHDITANINCDSSSVVNTVNSEACSTIDVYNIYSTYTGLVSTSDGSCVTIKNGAGSLTTTSAKVHECFGDLGGAHYQILVGDDGVPTTANNISGIQIYNNNITNSDHGIILGYVTGGLVFKNKVRSSVIGVIGKSTTSCKFYYNIITDTKCTGGALRSKGGTNDEFYNNVSDLSGYVAAVGINADDNGATHSTGVVYKNNIIYSSGNNVFVRIAANNTATLDYNCYYGSTNSSPFSWLGTDYATFALYKAASSQDAHSLNADPKLRSATDFHLQSTSPCIGAGTNTPWASAGATVTDYDGNPVADATAVYNRQIGGVEKTNVDIGAYNYEPDSVRIEDNSPTSLFIAKGGYYNASSPYVWTAPTGSTKVESGTYKEMCDLTLTSNIFGVNGVSVADGTGQATTQYMNVGTLGGIIKNIIY